MGIKGKHRGGTFNINYHIVFCPKRRSSVLVGNISLDCRDIIEEIIRKSSGKIEKIEISPDCVNLLVSIHPKISPHILVKKIKSASSNLLRKKYPQLLRMSALWSSSYYIGTVGHVSESVIKLYVESQKSV